MQHEEDSEIIIALRKENEELKERARHAERQLLKDTKKVFDDGADKREITRLKKLLRRAKEYIPYCYINGEPERHTKDCKYPYGKCKCHLEETLTEIENAIGHEK